MKYQLAITAAVALLAGTVLAVAQGRQTPSAGPTAQPQATSPQDQGAREEGGRQGEEHRSGPAQSGPERRSGQAQQGQEHRSGEAQEGQERRSGQRQEGQERRSGQAEQGRGDRGGSNSASLSTDQRTKIRETVLHASNAPRVAHVDFKVDVGIVVPKTVHVVAVPETVVEIHPAWRGFLYFIVGDQIVIVEPASLKIVAVIAA